MWLAEMVEQVRMASNSLDARHKKRCMDEVVPQGHAPNCGLHDASRSGVQSRRIHEASRDTCWVGHGTNERESPTIWNVSADRHDGQAKGSLRPSVERACCLSFPTKSSRIVDSVWPRV
jgi:hypothetical protein